VLEDVREALRLGDPGAVDAFDQLKAGAMSLVREYQTIADDVDAHREQDDSAEDDHHEDDPGARVERAQSDLNSLGHAEVA
jgi:hypothetical protein